MFQCFVTKNNLIQSNLDLIKKDNIIKISHYLLYLY